MATKDKLAKNLTKFIHLSSNIQLYKNHLLKSGIVGITDKKYEPLFNDNEVDIAKTTLIVISGTND